MARSQRAARSPSVIVISSADEDCRPKKASTSPQNKPIKTLSSPSKFAAIMQNKSRNRSTSSESARSDPPQRKKQTPIKKAQQLSTMRSARSEVVQRNRRPASPVKRSEIEPQDDPSPSSSNSSTGVGNQRSKRQRFQNDSESESFSPPPRRKPRRRFDRGSSDESDSEDDWPAPKTVAAKDPQQSEGRRKRGRPKKVTMNRGRSSDSQSSSSPSPAPSLPRTRYERKTRQPSPVDTSRPTRGAKPTSQRTPQKMPTTSARMSSEGTFRREEPPKESKAQPDGKKTPPPVCVLCERSEDDRVRYFRMDSQDDLHAHYLCMFTASNLSQTEDARVKKAGTICGFLCANVQKEKRRASRLHCKYCKKRGAAVGCAVKSCRASYHYPCGVENKCFYRFHGSFESFCPDHIPTKQFARPKDTKNVKKECVICLDEPDLKNKFDTLVTPCCNRALHRECLAGHAVNAGKHFLKCPSCNMVDNFKSFCEQVGIHVPNADATWMADEEAEREREDQEPEEDIPCAADDCMCPNGKTFDENVAGRDWNIEVCSNGCQKQMHAACMKHIGTKGKDQRHLCAECFDLEVMIEKRLGRKINVAQPARASQSGSPEIPMVRPTRRGRSSGAS